MTTGSTAALDAGVIHPALITAANAATRAWRRAVLDHNRAELIEAVASGADGTPSSRLDELVETEIIGAVEPLKVNVLSEEAGFIDRGSALTLVIDPVDGTGNAAAGVPFAGFTGAVAIDGRYTEGLTLWLDTGRHWWADRAGRSTAATPPIGAGGGLPLATTARRSLDGSIVSMLRPKDDPSGFLAVADRADRVRILGSSSIEAALVADGHLDAFCDPGTRTHRIVDLAAAVVLLEAAGGVVVDVHGRSVEFTTDIAGRWSGVCAATPELADELLELLS